MHGKAVRNDAENAIYLSYFFKMLRQLAASQAVELTQATLQALNENKVGNYVHYYKESLT